MGKMKTTCKVKDTPQLSATHPRMVVAMPPIPMARPRISPEGIPGLMGGKPCFGFPVGHGQKIGPGQLFDPQVDMFPVL